MIVPTTLLLLQYCPCPSHNILLDYQNNPVYTLWNLEPCIRRCWIMSLFVLLYKVSICWINKISISILFVIIFVMCNCFPQYNYKKPPLSLQVMNLIKIVLNTLNAQHHVCHRIPPTVIMPTAPQSHSRG